MLLFILIFGVLLFTELLYFLTLKQSLQINNVYNYSLRYRFLNKLDLEFPNKSLKKSECYTCISLKEYRKLSTNPDIVISQVFTEQEISLIKQKLAKTEKINNAPRYLSILDFDTNKIKGKYKQFHYYECKLCKQYEPRIYTFNLRICYYGRRVHICDRRYNAEDILRIYESAKILNKFKIRNVTPKRTITLLQRQRILRRDKFTCQLCGAKGPGAGGNAVLEVDHKLPLSRGGTDNDSNLQTLCFECNRGKKNNYID